MCYNDSMFLFFVTSRRTLPHVGLLFVSGLFLFLIAGCGSQIQKSLEVQSTLAEAYRHAQVDPDDKQARQWADKAIAIAPSSAVTYFGDPTATTPGPQIGVADIFEAVGDDAALSDYMQQAVQKFPDDERGYLFLMDSQNRLGRIAEKKTTAAKLVILLTKKVRMPGTKDIAVLTDRLAWAYWFAGDAANGTAEYKKAISAYPSLSSYETVVSPIDIGPYNGLANAYADTNTNLPEALGLAQKALAFAQNSKSLRKDYEVAGTQDTLGWVQYRMGNYKEAEQNLLQAANAVPRLPEVRYHLGAVYAAEGKTDAARAEFGHAVLLSPGYVDAQQALDKLPK